MTVSLAQLREMAATLKKNAVPRLVVQSVTEAQAITRSYSGEHVWRVGEEYYLLPQQAVA